MKIEAGQDAVVTGGASGISYGLAGQLGSCGVNVALADIRESGLAQAKGSLTSAGIDVVIAVAGVGDPMRCIDSQIRQMPHRRAPRNELRSGARRLHRHM